MSVPGVLGCHHIRTRGLDRSRVPRSARLAAAGHAPDRRARPVARREGSADGALSADRRRHHPHRAAAADCQLEIADCRIADCRLANSDFEAFARRKAARRARRRDAAVRHGARATATPVVDGDRQRVVAAAVRRRLLLVAGATQSLPGVQPRVRAVADGNTGGATRPTLGGGETDKHLIYEGLSRVSRGRRAVRRRNDSRRRPRVLGLASGAGGLRASLGMPRHPTQIVATLTGSISSAA